MQARLNRPPRNTGPIEVRDYAPSGRKWGTFADCYEGSPWELHRGELVEQMGSKDIHGILMALIAALFRTHARPELTVMTDVYCDLSDDEGPSLRAPDVALVAGLSRPKDDFFRGTPIIAVEVRATQSKRYLEEKVKLYLEHDWPCTWIVHAERGEVEVTRPGVASVTYRPGAAVPLGLELSKYGLTAVPVTALFNDAEFARYADEWVQAKGEIQGRAEGEIQGRTEGEIQGRAAALLAVLAARSIPLSDGDRARITTCTDSATLDRWLVAAATAQDAATFSRVLVTMRAG